MKAFLITYDLKQKFHDYTPLYNEIKKALKWWHYLSNTWIIITEEDTASWTRRLGPLTIQGDFLLIVEIKRNANGWLPKEAWDWLNTNIPFF